MDIIEVYHGSTETIKSPRTDKGRPHLDFGPGFYITDIYSQAESWAKKMADQRNSNPILNIYLLDRSGLLKNCRHKIFLEYNQEWLEFVAACRMGLQPWKGYDYIEGGVADDRVVDTVRLFMGGLLPLEDTLKRLKYFRPANQICILSQEILERYLEYNRSIEL